jgi:two-component system response regulator
MEPNEVEILLVEDNPHEAALTIRSLKKHNLANKLLHIDDGAEALDYIFRKENMQQYSNI